ncbi:MAG: DUF2723 domain-containing protein [Chlorobi bacterium]|nr:DUF2723 domain-containing protein [Chlorobiota bacterium]
MSSGHQSPSVAQSAPEATPRATLLGRLQRPGAIAVAVSAITFILYLLTLNPSFGFVDKGEMAAVASTLGITHPTGYPTLMLLGYLFTQLIPVREALALNILSALLTAASNGVMTLLFYHLATKFGTAQTGPAGQKPTPTEKPKEQSKRSIKRERKGTPNQNLTIPLSATTTTTDLPAAAATAEPDPTTGLIAGCAALLTGLTATWWNQGNGFEVYSLHALMLPLIVLLFLRYLDQQQGGREDNPTFSRQGWAFSVAVGISFTNHLSTVLLAPALLALFFARLGFSAASFRRLLLLVPGFLLGLLPYLWLPLRAAMNPLFNWGDPVTLQRFFGHITGQQYQVWMFSKDPVIWDQQSTFYLGNLPAELGYVGLAVVALGVFWWGNRDRRWVGLTLAIAGLCVLAATATILPTTGNTPEQVANPMAWSVAYLAVATVGGWFLARRGAPVVALAVLLFGVCLIWSSGYEIMEIGPYYMAATFGLGILLLGGLLALRRWLGSRGVIALGAVLVGITIATNFHQSDERGNTVVEDMTFNMLNTLPKNALILSQQWDFWVAGSFYLQSVQGVRPDVLVIDPELLRRSWYIKQLQHSHPEFMKMVQPEINRFMKPLLQFEADEQYNPAEIEAAYVGLLSGMIDKSMPHRPVFVTGEVRTDISARWRHVPYNLALRLMPDTTYLPQQFPNYRFSHWAGRIDSYTAKAYELYARSALARFLYERGRGNTQLARRYAELALSFNPNWDPEKIPDQPMNGEDQITGMNGFFLELQRTVGR